MQVHACRCFLLLLGFDTTISKKRSRFLFCVRNFVKYSHLTVKPFEYLQNFACSSQSARPALSKNAIAFPVSQGIYEMILHM